MSFKSCFEKLKSRISNRKTDKHQVRVTDEPSLSLLTDPSEEARKKKREQVARGKRQLKWDACILLPYPQDTPCGFHPVITVTAPDGTTFFPHFANKTCKGPKMAKAAAPPTTELVFCWDETNKETENGLLDMLNKIAQLEWDFKSTISGAKPMLATLADPASDLCEAIYRVYSGISEAKQKYCNLLQHVEGGLPPHTMAQANQQTENWLQNTSKYTGDLDRLVSNMVLCDQHSKVNVAILPALIEGILKNYPKY